ncbi:acyl-CoA dehydrogenase family protein [Martelella sp. FOR1707]
MIFHLLNEEQTILASSLDGWFRANIPPVTERQPGTIVSQAAFAELGLLGLLVPERHGGLEASGVELAVVGGLLGRHLVAAPFLPTAILAAGLINACGDEKQKSDWLPPLVAGEQAWSAALYERGQGYDCAAPETKVREHKGQLVLNGSKIGLEGDIRGQNFIVSARDEKGEMGLYVVDADACAIDVADGVDGASISAVRFNNVPVLGKLAASGDVPAALENVIDHCLVFTSAEAVGAMGYAYEATLEYIQNRKQFGQRLSDFQVLRHRAVEMKMELDLASAMVASAARELSGPYSRRYAVAAKATTGRAGRFVGQEALQLHGGMGMTHEMAVGRYLKRLIALDASFGNAVFQERQFENFSRGLK